MKNTQRTTNNEQRTCGAFTLIELIVAVAIFAMVFAVAGMIFKVCINSYRTAVANAEIIQKLHAITDQLNADFKGLQKNGEIFVIWKDDPVSHERFDRIMFFADGDFQSYEPYKDGQRDPSGEPIQGPLARISYMLANKPDGPNPPIRPSGQEPRKRILARTQHILTAAAQFNDIQTPTDVNPAPDWYKWNNLDEYEHDDMNSLDKWKNMSSLQKGNSLSVITDVNVNISADPTVNTENVRGTMVDLADANLIHNIFCEGVGEFKVQGWYDAGKRWVPEVDPNRDGAYSDFFPVGDIHVPGVLYPYPPYGQVILNGGFDGVDFSGLLNEAQFNEIPGLGRALKFTFTLYDSKGVFKQGRTFTHIVYIGN